MSKTASTFWTASVAQMARSSILDCKYRSRVGSRPAAGGAPERPPWRGHTQAALRLKCISDTERQTPKKMYLHIRLSLFVSFGTKKWFCVIQHPPPCDYFLSLNMKCAIKGTMYNSETIKVAVTRLLEYVEMLKECHPRFLNNKTQFKFLQQLTIIAKNNISKKFTTLVPSM